MPISLDIFGAILYNFSYTTIVEYFLRKGCVHMETRVAVMAIIVENLESAKKINALLHEYSDFIIGRMGIPYKAKGISIMSVAIDAPQDTVSALAGKLGSIEGVSVKTACSNV